MKKGEIGTVIEGTLRIYDLHHAFAGELQRLDPVAWERILHPADGVPVLPGDAVMDSSHGWWETEAATCLLAELEDALGECAPDGCYFGAHYGDGADFGFWESE